MSRWNCDCDREGRDAYRYDRYSYETQHRLEEGRYGHSECDREFADGFRHEQRRDEERREAEEAYDREMAQRAYERRQEQEAAYADECAQAYYAEQEREYGRHLEREQAAAFDQYVADQQQQDNAGG